MTRLDSIRDACFAFVDQDGGKRAFSLGQTQLAVDATVAWLEHTNRNGSRTLVVDLPNCPAFVWLLLACARTGHMLVALNHRLSPADKQLRLEQLQGTVAQDYQAVGPDEAACLEAAVQRAIDGPGGPSCTASPSWTPGALLESAARGEIALVMFTSGTTGTPKAATLTWGQLLASARMANKMLGCGRTSLWQAALPLCHIGGLQVVLRSFLAQAPFLLYARVNPGQLLQDAQDHAATHVSVVDKMLQDLLAEDVSRTEPAIGGYQCLLLGGAALNWQTLDRARAAHARVFASFGMTETASAVAWAPADDAFDGGAALSPDIEARVLDPNQEGKGLLALKGPCVTHGYLNAQADFTSDGFFITGDVARLERGRLYVYERLGDMFVSGGENVYPAEIERAINQIPGVSASYVFGMQDPTWGRVPVALVEGGGAGNESPASQARPSSAGVAPACDALAQAISQELAGHLSRFAQPRHVVVVPTIPRHGIGKIDRKAAQRLAEQHLQNLC